MATNYAGPKNITNFPGGLSTAYEYQTLGKWIYPDPTIAHTWFDDFDDWSASEWIVTLTGTGTNTVNAGADNGLLVVDTVGVTDNQNVFNQWSGLSASTTVETWKFIAGQPLWFKTRLQISDATNSDFVIGLQITDTSPLAVTDGVYFLKVEDSTTVNLLVTKNSTSTTTSVLAPMVAATWYTLGFYYNGNDAIDIFLDENRIGSSVTTNLVDDEELTISFGLQTGENAAKTMTIDYILVSKIRV